MTTMMDVLREVHSIAGRALVSLDIRDGTEAWITFSDTWERDEFHHNRHTVTTNGKTFILLDPNDMDTRSDFTECVPPCRCGRA